MSEKKIFGFCNSCRFFIQDEESKKDDTGECRRHAPRPVEVEQAVDVGAYWPIVLETDGCGEWRPNETGETPRAA